VIERRVSALEAMTAGVNVPFDLEIVEDLHAALPRRLGEGKLADLIALPLPTGSWIASHTGMFSQDT
jgi:hypothetical protein